MIVYVKVRSWEHFLAIIDDDRDAPGTMYPKDFTLMWNSGVKTCHRFMREDDGHIFDHSLVDDTETITEIADFKICMYGRAIDKGAMYWEHEFVPPAGQVLHVDDMLGKTVPATGSKEGITIFDILLQYYEQEDGFEKLAEFLKPVVDEMHFNEYIPRRYINFEGGPDVE